MLANVIISGDLSCRLKFNKLKYGSDHVPGEEQKSNSNDAPTSADGTWHSHGVLRSNLFRLDENKDAPDLVLGESSVSFKQGRQLLRQWVIGSSLCP